jgi:hypothetical protein
VTRKQKTPKYYKFQNAVFIYETFGALFERIGLHRLAAKRYNPAVPDPGTAAPRRPSASESVRERPHGGSK